MIQPARGGRHRLYCSNAHRAEARRRRLAGAPEPAPADALDASLERLAGVLEELRAHRDRLRSIDPAHQALEVARLRAEATAGVLAAQEAARTAAESASRAREELATERAVWEDRRRELAAEVENLRATAGAARANAAAAQDALDTSVVAHRAELDGRDRAAARAASAHEAELRRLAGDLDRARTALAAAQARADAADRRAAAADAEAQSAGGQARQAGDEAHRLALELERAHAAAGLAAARAEAGERQLAEARAELAEERRRHDLGAAELRGQLERLLAAAPKRAGAATKATPGRRDAAKPAKPKPAAGS